MADEISLPVPVGLQTPEGSARVEAAVEKLDEHDFAVAELAAEFIEAFDSAPDDGHEDGWLSELSALRDAVLDRDEIHTVVVNAMAGVATKGVCQFCCCRDANACADGCSWANEEHTVCTSSECLEKFAATGKAAA